MSEYKRYPLSIDSMEKCRKIFNLKCPFYWKEDGLSTDSLEPATQRALWMLILEDENAEFFYITYNQYNTVTSLNYVPVQYSSLEEAQKICTAANRLRGIFPPPLPPTQDEEETNVGSTSENYE